MGRAAAVLDAAGLTFEERLISAGEPLPALGEVAGILSLGGRESVTELDRYPYLQDEERLLREAVEAGVPVLGVCLGGQLLAHALGGSVRRAPAREIRWFAAERLPAADGDPLFGGLPEAVSFVRWNEDAFELPPDGVELLRRTGAGADAFRVGDAAWGVQFHPELDGDMLDGWYGAYPETLRQAGVSEAEARAADAANAPAQEALAAALFGAFAGIVREREPARSL
jgi:GMP synthase-like glutamine amidotransferase